MCTQSRIPVCATSIDGLLRNTSGTQNRPCCRQRCNPLQFLPQVHSEILTADPNQGWNAVPDPDGRVTTFQLASWVNLPKLERLTLPFYSLGMWSTLLQRVNDQDVELTVTEWNRSGAEFSGGSPSQRLDAAVRVLKALRSASVTIRVMTVADKLNADHFQEQNLPPKPNVRYTVVLIR